MNGKAHAGSVLKKIMKIEVCPINMHAGLGVGLTEKPFEPSIENRRLLVCDKWN